MGHRSAARPGRPLALVAIVGVLVATNVPAAEPQPPAERPAAPEASSLTSEDPNAIPPALQGPAIRTPHEILDMLEQRKQALARKEEALRVAEGRIATLKAEVEQILARYEAQVKAAQQQQSKTDVEAQKASLAQVAKMYETMAPEEAAARIEKMPNKMALQVLRMLKGQTAGNILALVSPDKAAKLTERFITRP